jgi:hypothetical protein
MRILFGIVLGVILTVAGTYCYDVATGKAVVASDRPQSPDMDNRPLVNWDVVDRDWHSLEANLRGMLARIQEQWMKRSG